MVIIEVHSVYIHIPFCSNICSYCDFSKFYYNELWVDNYLTSLEREIKLYYNDEVINTIYIGGGTPSCLNINQLKKLFAIIKNFKVQNLEFTFECNVDITLDKLLLLKENNVNRISVGVQTINTNLLKTIGRFHTKDEVINKINLIKQYFDNINIDLMYALPNETMADLKKDLDFIISLDVNHISTYSLIIEPNTKLYIDKVKNIDEQLDYDMYKLIKSELLKKGYKNYEISNYSKDGYESKHNLVYWNNLNYYGFGIGSSGYIDNIRYDNTRSYKEYINSKYRLNYHELDLKETIENEFILGLRKIDGINISTFKNKYNMDIFSIPVVKKMLKDKKLLLEDNQIKIPEQYLYVSNSILVEFIDF